MNLEYWEERYQAGDMPWEKGEASPGLIDFLVAHPDLPRGTVAVPGCGSGHDVRAFASAGFLVHGFDLAPSAIIRAEEQTRAAGLTAQFQVADFLFEAPPNKFDRLFEHTLFCAIKPQERDEYVRAVERWLAPEGNYLAVNYLLPPDQAGPPFSTTRTEQIERFSPWLELVAEWTPRSFSNRTGLELMFWWRRKSR